MEQWGIEELMASSNDFMTLPLGKSRVLQMSSISQVHLLHSSCYILSRVWIIWQRLSFQPFQVFPLSDAPWKSDTITHQERVTRKVNQDAMHPCRQHEHMQEPLRDRIARLEFQKDVTFHSNPMGIAKTMEGERGGGQDYQAEDSESHALSWSECQVVGMHWVSSLLRVYLVVAVHQDGD